jgi:autotransporter-associated beta strand protein
MGGTLAFYVNSFTFSNNINISTAGTIFVDSGLTITSTGTVNGATNDLTKAGAGTLVFGGEITGNLVATGGTVQANPNNIDGNIVLSNNATVDFTSSGSFANSITGDGNIEISASTSVTLSGTGSNYDGTTTLDTGATLVVGDVGNLGTGGVALYAASTLGFTGDNSYGGNITVADGSGTLSFASGSNTTLAGTLTKDGTTLVLSSDAAHVWIAGQVVGSSANSDIYFNNTDVSSAAVYTLSSAMSYNGPTYITDGSQLVLDTGGSLPATTALTLSTSNTMGSIYNLQTFSSTIASLASNFSGTAMSDNNQVTGGAGSSLTVAPTSSGIATFGGQLTGQMSFAFSGVAGSAQVLASTANDYSGATSVNSGALIVNGSIVGSGAAVTVGATNLSNPGILAGDQWGSSGSIARDVTVNNGAYLSPGNAVPDLSNPSSTALAGFMSIAGNVTVSGVYLWDLTALGSPSSSPQSGGGTSFDQIALNSHQLTVDGGSLQVVLTGATTPNLTDPFWLTTEKWEVMTGISTLNLNTQLGLMADTYAFGSFSIEQNLSGGALILDWSPTAVPEPGTLLLGALAASGLGGYGWRKRKNQKAAATEAT